MELTDMALVPLSSPLVLGGLHSLGLHKNHS